ncbi:Uncharacterised protein [Mycobacterium tuberculosis]|nr:Uncharacterised protein [Mycobacterium tuberculosis]CKW20987.1 Uncharacterised protein [Mycobacterium tuberculosis]SGO34930.1 Uncharacterised protein [Mycobacterium tuberculosis]
MTTRTGESRSRASAITAPSKTPISDDPSASTTIHAASRPMGTRWGRTIATGHCADNARAAAVDPTRSGRKWCTPIAPTHTRAAAAEARINEVTGRSWVISTSTLTGRSAASTAVNA